MLIKSGDSLLECEGENSSACKGQPLVRKFERTFQNGLTRTRVDYLILCQKGLDELVMHQGQSIKEKMDTFKIYTKNERKRYDLHI